MKTHFRRKADEELFLDVCARGFGCTERSFAQTKFGGNWWFSYASDSTERNGDRRLSHAPDSAWHNGDRWLTYASDSA
jgi:hypothetical protein